MKESLKSKFLFNDLADGDILEKKISFDFNSLIGNLKNIIVFIISILVSGLKLASGATPFGMAIFAAINAVNIPLIVPWLLISVTTGICFGGTALIKFLISSILYVFIKAFIKNENTKIGNSARIIFSVAIAEIVGLALNGMLIYDALMAVYMSITTAIFYMIFAEGLLVIMNAFEKNAFSTEQVTAGGILITIILSSFSKLSIFGMTLSGIVGVLIIMLLGWRRGAAIGASSGISIAIVLSLIGYGNIALVATYGFCGLLAGILARFGKIGAIAGFVFGNIILAFYANGQAEVIVSLKEIIVASIVLFFLPKSVTVIIDDLFDYNAALPEGKDGYIEESTMLKLGAACDVVEDIAENVYSKEEEQTTSDAMGSFIKTLNDNTCKRCENYEKCWVHNYHQMYETTFNSISVLQTKGEIKEENLEDSCCENKILFADGLNFSYEIYKVNQDWQQRMNENKLHISKQLKEVSNALNKMKNEMRETVVVAEKEDAKYSLEIGIAKKKKNNSIISGDSTTVIKLKDGKVLVGLSDGMGSGEVAARNSKKVMLTLEKFLNTGFDKETAVKLLNSYLLIGKEEDNFATLDVAIFDQNTCEVDFVKVSACPTLVKENGKVKEISSMSLPIGIIDDIDVDLKAEKLKKGDFFVMMTDGVTDISTKLPNERDINHLLSEIKTEDSQRLADIILQEMLDATYGIARDDMTVLVVKVV